VNVKTIVSTHGFSDEPDHASQTFVAKSLATFVEQPKVDFVVGDPKATEDKLEDQRRTVRVPYTGTTIVYAKVDGGELTPEQWAEQGHPEYPVLTFLLASEY